MFAARIEGQDRMHEIDDAPQQGCATGARHSALLVLHPQSAAAKRRNFDKAIVVAKSVVWHQDEVKS